MTGDFKKKLIEVALPLEAINAASSREKSIRHGHPSTLHLWWARRPLAACRAVLFGQLVDDPSAHPDRFPTPEAQEKERGRLFRLIEELVKWENSNDEAVLKAARAEIMRSTGGNPPPVFDPFCGGGSIPLEAQRLGLKVYASDLNPVAVLITKALVEFPPKFAGRPPVNPEARSRTLSLSKSGTATAWKGAAGLADDVRYYGKWMRNEAEKCIGHLYPKAKLPDGKEATVIAWLWARTVKCPNPACGAQMPLVRSFELSKREGKRTWVRPVVDNPSKSVTFEVRSGSGAAPGGTVQRTGARCIICDSPVPFDHVRAEAQAGRMRARLMAIVAENASSRSYLSPDSKHEQHSVVKAPADAPDTDLPERALGFRVQAYGMTKHRDLFTPRQLVALTAFSDLVKEAREKVLTDARSSGMSSTDGRGGDGARLADGGDGPAAYADAVATYLAFAVDKSANLGSSIVSWMNDRGALRETFARQAIPMVWDFAEANPFCQSGGSFQQFLERIVDVIAPLLGHDSYLVSLRDAVTSMQTGEQLLVTTDPPYYDNIGYADLSDFFYIWLRRSLLEVHPKLFATLLTPKGPELVATPYRFAGNRAQAEQHFESGLAAAFANMRSAQDPAFPAAVFYAFKQAEESEDEAGAVVVSTGWQTMLQGLVDSGFGIVGTWPMRTESEGRAVARGTNALASSVALICRPRQHGAPLATRSEFIAALRQDLPGKLRLMKQGSIAPVDLPQSAIGAGMEVFSRYSKIVEADGTTMRVGPALALINQVLYELETEQEGEYDPATRWAVTWFEQNGTAQGPYGEAESLSKAKNTAVDSMVRSGIVKSGGGKVRLVPRAEMQPEWAPSSRDRLTIWEATQRLVLAHDTGGEAAAGGLVAQLGGDLSDRCRDLAYRLFSICEKKGWAQDAIPYNALVAAWPQILAEAVKSQGPLQGRLA